MDQIIISSHVEFTLKKISKKLYDDEYFAFVEDAENYVQKLRKFFLSIPKQKARKTLNKKFGTFYCRYKYNHKTTWYIGFDMEDDIYLIKFVTNNHSADYPKFV